MGVREVGSGEPNVRGFWERERLDFGGLKSWMGWTKEAGKMGSLSGCRSQGDNA